MRRRLSLEDINQIEAAATDAVASEVGDNANSLETELLEAAETENEVADTEVVVDEAVDTAAALENYAYVCGRAVKSGGLDRNGALAVRVGLEHLYGRMGWETAPKLSMESFGGAGSRIQATQLALEGIKDKIVEIWKQIVAAIKSGMKKVSEFFYKIFGAAESLKKRADKLAEQANKVTGSLKDSDAKTIENERLVKALFQGSDVKGIAGAKEVAEVTKNVFTSWKAQIKTCEGLVDVLDDIAGGDSAKADTFSVPFTKPAGLSGGARADQKPSVAGVSVHRSGELPGGKAVFIVCPDSAFTTAEQVNAFAGGIHTFLEKEKVPSKTKLPTLAASDCGAAAATIGELADVLIEYRKEVESANKVKDKASKAAEKIAKHVANTDFTEEKDDGQGGKVAANGSKDSFTKAKAIATKFTALCDQPVLNLSSYALQTGKAYLDYVEESLKKYA